MPRADRYVMTGSRFKHDWITTAAALVKKVVESDCDCPGRCIPGVCSQSVMDRAKESTDAAG